MKIAISANQEGLTAPLSPIMGRCPVFVIVNTETMEAESIANPALSAPGGAGIQAAQYLVGQNVQAILTQNIGPNAFNVFQAAGIPVYISQGATVQEAVEAYKADQLKQLTTETTGAHRGMQRGGGRRQRGQ